MDQKNIPAQSSLSNFSPVHIFIFGIVQGILVLSTIGFFIMLNLYFGAGDSDNGTLSRTGAEQLPTNPDQGGQFAPPAAVDIRFAAVDEKTDHIRGNKNAKITLIEYSDFQCPFCGQFSPTVQKILDTYADDVRLVYRHLPLRSIHPQAAIAAEASECAAEQGKFWEFHDALFANQAAFSGDISFNETAKKFFTTTAANLRLNASQFTNCMTSGKYASKVQQQEQDAQAAGGRGTPYTVLVGPNGETVPLSGAQPYSAVEAAVLQFVN